MKLQPNICQEEQGKTMKHLRIVSALAQIWSGHLPTDAFSTTNASVCSVSMQIMALWIVMPCSFAVMCQHTEGTRCRLHQACGASPRQQYTLPFKRAPADLLDIIMSMKNALSRNTSPLFGAL